MLLEDTMLDELIARWDELKPKEDHGFESVGAGPDEIKAAAQRLEEGTAGVDRGLEAIILQFGRPAYLVRDDAVDTENTPSSSKEMDDRVDAAKEQVSPRIPSVGRVDLRNWNRTWVGTGWVIAPDIVVTNRHVAQIFASAKDDGFDFRVNYGGKSAKAYLDFKHEHLRGTESVFRMPEVLWIAEDGPGQHDVAFLRIRTEGEDDQPLPEPIPLISDADFASLTVDDWVGVVGYPAQSTYNDKHDQQRIFQGIFDVKRFQPGKITAITQDGLVEHDATTLGGNSGSTVLDLRSGAGVALHFGGFEGDTNFAVAAPIIRSLLHQHVPNTADI